MKNHSNQIKVKIASYLMIANKSILGKFEVSTTIPFFEKKNNNDKINFSKKIVALYIILSFYDFLPGFFLLHFS